MYRQSELRASIEIGSLLLRACPNARAESESLLEAQLYGERNEFDSNVLRKERDNIEQAPDQPQHGFCTEENSG